MRIGVMEYWSDGVKYKWNIGMVEVWRNDNKNLNIPLPHYFITPLFHYSIIPLFRSDKKILRINRRC
jgi:hypothetical protein